MATFAIPWPKQLQKQFADFIDPDSRKTSAQRAEWLLHPLCHPGQQVYDTDEGIWYYVNRNMTAWEPLGGGPEAGPVAWGDILGKPTTVTGYGITDVYTKTGSDSRYLKLTGGNIAGGLTLIGKRVLTVDDLGPSAIPQTLPDASVVVFDVSKGYNAIWNIGAGNRTLSMVTDNGDNWLVDIIGCAGQEITLSGALSHWLVNKGVVTRIILPPDGRISLTGKHYGDYFSWTVMEYRPEDPTTVGVEWVDILNKPTTISGYGISDAYTKTVSDGRFSAISHVHDERYALLNHTHPEYAPVAHDHDGVYVPLTRIAASVNDANTQLPTLDMVKQLITSGGTPADPGIYVDWANVLNTPTTIAGYGILDAFTQAVADTLYSPLGHTHAGYAPTAHNHDDRYSLLAHLHDERYSQIGHVHDDRYSQLGHTHDGRYLQLTGGDVTGSLSVFSKRVLTVDDIVEFNSHVNTLPLVSETLVYTDSQTFTLLYPPKDVVGWVNFSNANGVDKRGVKYTVVGNEITFEEPLAPGDKAPLVYTTEAPDATGSIDMSDYYNKAESDARFASIVHNHGASTIIELEDMPGEYPQYSGPIPSFNYDTQKFEWVNFPVAFKAWQPGMPYKQSDSVYVADSYYRVDMDHSASEVRDDYMQGKLTLITQGIGAISPIATQGGRIEIDPCAAYAHVFSTGAEFGEVQLSLFGQPIPNHRLVVRFERNGFGNALSFKGNFEETVPYWNVGAVDMSTFGANDTLVFEFLCPVGSEVYRLQRFNVEGSTGSTGNVADYLPLYSPSGNTVTWSDTSGRWQMQANHSQHSIATGSYNSRYGAYHTNYGFKRYDGTSLFPATFSGLSSSYDSDRAEAKVYASVDTSNKPEIRLITSTKDAVGGTVTGKSELLLTTQGVFINGVALNSGGSTVADSTTNGNILIDGVETTVYTLPAEVVTDTEMNSALSGYLPLSVTSPKEVLVDQATTLNIKQAGTGPDTVPWNSYFGFEQHSTQNAGSAFLVSQKTDLYGMLSASFTEVGGAMYPSAGVYVQKTGTSELASVSAACDASGNPYIMNQLVWVDGGGKMQTVMLERTGFTWNGSMVLTENTIELRNEAVVSLSVSSGAVSVLMNNSRDAVVAGGVTPTAINIGSSPLPNKFRVVSIAGNGAAAPTISGAVHQPNVATTEWDGAKAVNELWLRSGYDAAGVLTVYYMWI